MLCRDHVVVSQKMHYKRDRIQLELQHEELAQHLMV